MTATSSPKIQISDELLEKHRLGLKAAYDYYVLNQPTGMMDSEYDRLEADAMADGFSLRDYVLQEIQGTRTQNAGYITKVEKTQVQGDMFDALLQFIQEHPEVAYVIPKYDGSSLAGYYDTNTGKCMRVVTIGGSNLGGEGIDQTYKFIHFFPDFSGTSFRPSALQAECLTGYNVFGESARQKANGLVTSSFKPLDRSEYLNKSQTYERYLQNFEINRKRMEEEVTNYVQIRCFRYFGAAPGLDYKQVLDLMPQTVNLCGDIKFSGGFVIPVSELTEDKRDLINHDVWDTPTGKFLVDGVVCYTSDGVCVKALKYKDAGRGESAEVDHIQWNNNRLKGKDSWSANVYLKTPVVVRGSEIKKPSVGSVSKMVERGLSKGARVNVILANSTIPMVKDVISPGNGDYQWPTCSCGYQMSKSDIFGTLLKCGNPLCSERLEYMRNYMSGITDFMQINLNNLLVIDRFKWEQKADLTVLLPELLEIVKDDLGVQVFQDKLASYMTTPLMKKNLDLVVQPSYMVLHEFVHNGTISSNS